MDCSENGMDRAGCPQQNQLQPGFKKPLDGGIARSGLIGLAPVDGIIMPRSGVGLPT